MLVLVGANHGGAYGALINDAIRAAGAKDRIRIAGWSDHAVYHQYLQAADVGVQLRSVSRGETSAAVLDCMNYGLPTIVNANGSMAALPDETVIKLADVFEAHALTAALETLYRDGPLRAALGAKAAHLLHTAHSPDQCALQYRAALDLAHDAAGAGRHALIDTLAALTPDADERLLQQLSACVARAPDHLAQRQLLVDVTAIAQNDLRTGIERVVRTQLLELLQLRRPGLRVEPVYLCGHSGHTHYRYARNYTRRLLDIPGPAQADPLLDIQAGDVFYSADYSPGAVMAAAQAGVYANWRARGVGVHFLIHDLLPVLRPEFFPPRADLTHGAWLACIAAQADQIICISDAVAGEMAHWLTRHKGIAHAPALAVLHHGADIGDAAPPPPNRDDPLLAAIRAQPSFLMVGTIEPRKGHLQALSAFEQLWRDGSTAQLVIVGNEGWTPLPASERRSIPLIVERLQRHPELNKRLLWLRGIDDAFLQQVYLASACLLAPSEGEGFGLPLIEAARYGLPIIARDLPVFREVAQQHAHYFGGLDAADLAASIQRWLALLADGSQPDSAGMQWRTWQENAQELMTLLTGQME